MSKENDNRPPFLTMEKVCKCGCNQKFNHDGSRRIYIEGHRKNVKVAEKKPKSNPPKEDENDLHDDLISNAISTEKKHEFEEYMEKDAKGKRIDSVCIRAFIAAGIIALNELGMTKLSIKKNGYKFKVEKL